jgi:hypothetical protein
VKIDFGYFASAAALSFALAMAAPPLASACNGNGNCENAPGHTKGAPLPIAGAGLPILAIGYGVYWAVKRRRKKVGSLNDKLGHDVSESQQSRRTDF